MKKYLLMIILFSLALTSKAASLSLETPNPIVPLGTPFAVTVYLDPQGQSVNALEGNLTFPNDKLQLENVYGSDSIVSLWIERPHEAVSGTIAWSGIMPGGFGGVLEPNEAQPTPGQVAVAVFKPLQIGTATIGFGNVSVLLNDGRGTPATVTMSTLTVSVAASSSTAGAALPTALIGDNVPPEPFQINLSRSPNLFNDQWFIAFVAHDKGTGVASYDVLESRTPVVDFSSAAWQPVINPYVLKDQSLASYVYVRATDYAGNSRLASLPPTRQNALSPVLTYLLVIIIGAASFILWLTLRKRKN